MASEQRRDRIPRMVARTLLKAAEKRFNWGYQQRASEAERRQLTKAITWLHAYLQSDQHLAAKRVLKSLPPRTEG